MTNEEQIKEEVAAWEARQAFESVNGKNSPVIAVPNEIVTYFHCSRCRKEMEEGTLEEFPNYEVGYTKIGIQVWCPRHEINLIHLNFGGHKFPAMLSSKVRAAGLKVFQELGDIPIGITRPEGHQPEYMECGDCKREREGVPS